MNRSAGGKARQGQHKFGPNKLWVQIISGHPYWCGPPSNVLLSSSSLIFINVTFGSIYFPHLILLLLYFF